MGEKRTRLTRIAFIKEEGGKPFVLLELPSGHRTKAEIPGCAVEEQGESLIATVRAACIERFGVFPHDMEMLTGGDSADAVPLEDFWAVTKWSEKIKPPELDWAEIDHSLLSRQALTRQDVSLLEKLIPWAVNKFPAFYYLAVNEGLL